MKILLLFFWTASLAAATIGVDELPWTNSSWFWTRDGRRQIQVNRNLFGNSVSIGGQHFEKALCGHSGSSVIYNLNGTADAFTAFVGIEDEDHPQDNPREKNTVFIEAIVDRKRVYREMCANGDAPLLMKIDLRGKQQLELRGDFGEHFFRQRIAFGNPQFYTQDIGKLRSALEQSRKQWDSLYFFPVQRAFPEVPNWENISIQKVTYDTFQNAYCLSNGIVKMVILPEFGGRIISFSCINGQNLLLNNQPHNSDKDAIRGLAADRGGGHYMRPEPRNYYHPADPLLMYGPYQISFPSEGVVVMRSCLSPIFHFRYEYTIQMLTGQPEIRIENRIVNGDHFAQKIGVWSITRIDGGLLKRVWLPSEKLPAPKPMQVSPADSDIRMEKTADGFLIVPNFPDRKKRPCGFEMLYHAVETKIRINDTFSIKYNQEDTAENSPDWYPLHIWINSNFSEMEAHGPERLLPRGGSISLVESWCIE